LSQSPLRKSLQCTWHVAGVVRLVLHFSERLSHWKKAEHPHPPASSVVGSASGDSRETGVAPVVLRFITAACLAHAPT